MQATKCCAFVQFCVAE